MLRKSDPTGRSDRKTDEPVICPVQNVPKNQKGVELVKNRLDRSKTGKTIRIGRLPQLDDSEKEEEEP